MIYCESISKIEVIEVKYDPAEGDVEEGAGRSDDEAAAACSSNRNARE